MIADCERIRLLLQAQLPVSEARAVATHLARCPDCRPRLASLVGAVASRAPENRESASRSAGPGEGREPRWSLREAIALCLDPAALRRTATIALVVGIVLTSVNQLDIVLAGEATWLTGVKVGANFLVPFVVSNLGLLAGQPSSRMLS